VVAQPDSNEPEIECSYVLSLFAEHDFLVRELVQRATDETERLVGRLAEEPVE